MQKELPNGFAARLLDEFNEEHLCRAGLSRWCVVHSARRVSGEALEALVRPASEFLSVTKARWHVHVVARGRTARRSLPMKIRRSKPQSEGQGRGLRLSSKQPTEKKGVQKKKHSSSCSRN